MTDRDLHAHAVALWDELGELINASDGPSDRGTAVLEAIQRKLKLVADEAGKERRHG